MAIDWADSPFRDKTIAELVHEFGYIRGDLCEQATRDFFVELLQHHLADAWQRGLIDGCLYERERSIRGTSTMAPPASPFGVTAS